MTLPVREADMAFADLICADPEWLDAEFDALIGASFGEPPAPPPPAPPRLPPRPGIPRPPSRRARPGPAATPSPATGPHHGRQRSPPAHPLRPQGRRPVPRTAGRPHDSKQHQADGKEDETKTPSR
jgi:hypothetical protein